MKMHISLYLGVVAIEKAAFRSTSTKIANFTFTYYPTTEDTVRIF